MDAFEFHERGFPSKNSVLPPGMPESGDYHFRTGGEAHVNDPAGIASLQDAVREKNQKAYDAYSKNAHEQIKAVTLRVRAICASGVPGSWLTDAWNQGLLDFDYESRTPIPVDQVSHVAPFHRHARAVSDQTSR